MVHTGNPRITVAFPFSKVESGESREHVRDLAALTVRLAEQLDIVAHKLAPDQVEACDLLAAEARLLAIRLGAGP